MVRYRAVSSANSLIWERTSSGRSLIQTKKRIGPKPTDIILLDFSKAFDKVNHRKLLWKLHQYCIRGRELAWIRAFLGSRSQQVVIDGEESESIPVTSGVPQGSVLGPILFLIYINDLPDEVRSRVRLFADDTALYLTMESEDDRSAIQTILLTVPRRYFFCGSFMFLFCLVFAMFCARLFICALWSPAGKGLTSWLSFVLSSVSLSLSHWYPGSGVVLDCIVS